MLGERSHCDPVIVDNKLKGIITQLNRIPLAEKGVDEFSLQELIKNYPAILPVGEIDQDFAPLISIGREVSVKDGSIDNMLISPSGYITLVEAKLWRNPQARREVLAQIIDYAKDVTKWDWDDLDERVRIFNRVHRNSDAGLLETMRENELKENDEADFIDTVQRNLKTGRMLLLIVGDGIKENVESIVEFLQGFPQLRFTLALVELKVYKIDENRLMVVPNIVTRTKEIVRAVVKVEGDIQNVEVTVDTSTESNQGRRRTLSENDFFDILSKKVSEKEVQFVHLLMRDMDNLGCDIIWRQAAFVVRYPDPLGSGKMMTLFVVRKQGDVYPGWLVPQLKALDIPVQIGLDYVARTAKVMGVKVKGTNPDTWTEYVRLSKVQANYTEFLDEVERLIGLLQDYSSE